MGELGRGRFEVHEHLGSGGMGVVYRAFDRQRGMFVALKHLHQMDADGVARLKQEFRALADVAHPGLVPLYDLVATDDEWFFTMELVPGVGFDAFVTGGSAAHRPAPLASAGVTLAADSPPALLMASPSVALAPTLAATSEEAAAIAIANPPAMEGPPNEMESATAAAASASPLPPCPADPARLSIALKELVLAVSALHEAGKLHLDLKPSNVLAHNDGHIVVLDFGLVRDAASDADASGSATNEDGEAVVSGTPGYMAPEQARGEPLTEAADWYAVGVMLYQALTGRLPFTGDVRDVLALKLRADPEPPRARASGVPPALDALAMALLSRDPARRPTGAGILRALGAAVTAGASSADTTSAAAHAPARSAFVGREPELLALQKAFEETRSGKSVAVYIRGLSGMGKTTLAKHFLLDLRSRRAALVLTGRCYERELVPFKAVDSVIDALAEALCKRSTSATKVILPADTRALVRLFPALQKVVARAHEGPMPSDAPDPRELRARGFRALKELLGRLAAQAPLALFIDDLQWGDGDSAKLLAELFAPPDAPPLLLLGTYRAEEEATSPFLRELFGGVKGPTASDSTRVLNVGTLPPEDAEALARSLLGAAGSRASADENENENENAITSEALRAQAVAREAEGSPLFVGELVRHFMERDQSRKRASIDNGALTADGLARPSAEATSAEATSAAPSLRDLLGRRLDRLPEQARRALSVISIAASPIEQGVAMRAAGIHDGVDAAAALGILRAGRWIRTRGADALDAVETYHDRIREAAADIDAPSRRSIHLRIAEELEATGRADIEALAVHFGEGGDFEKGGAYAERAASEASHSLAFENAARLYRSALEWRPGDPTHARELYKKLGDAYVNAGRGPDAAAAYLRASEGAPDDEAIDLERMATERLLLSGHLDDGMRRLRPALAAVGLPYPESVPAALVAFMLRRARLRIRGESFVRRDEASVDGRLLRRLDVCYAALRGLLGVDPLRAALYGAEYTRLALDAGEPTRIARALALEVVTASMQDAAGAARVRSLVRLAHEALQGIDSPYLEVFPPLAEGFSLFTRAYYRDALAKMSVVDPILRDQCTGVSWEFGITRTVSSASLLNLGDIPSLSRRLPAWLKDADDRNDYFGVTLLYLMHAAGVMLKLAADEPDAARAELRAIVARLPRSPFNLQHFYALYSDLYVDRYRRDGRAEWRRIQEAWPSLKRSPSMKMSLFSVQMRMFRGMAALNAGRDAPWWERTRMARIAERDAGAVASAGPLWASPYSHLMRAGAAWLRGDEPKTITELRASLSGFKNAEMALFAAAAERRLGSLLGGDHGRALIAGADAFMSQQTIKNPARFALMLTPGF